MKNLFRIFLLLPLLVGAKPLLADHLIGGDISWECNGSGGYIFHLNIFRDCDGSGAPGGAQLKVWGHPSISNIPMSYTGSTDISPDCKAVSGGPSEITCTGGGSGAIEMAHYTSSSVNLPGTPPAGGWKFTWDGYSRGPNVDNIVDPTQKGITIRAIMYGDGGAASPCNDNSPVFMDPPRTIFCSGTDVQWGHLAVDPDADSITYSWDHPLDKLSSNFNPPADPSYLSFASGYSFDQPFPGPGENNSNEPATLDSKTGEIRLKSYTQGEFLHTIKVTSWRCGRKTAEVFREFQTAIVNCSGNNTPPSITSSIGNNLQDTVYAGETVSFKISVVDVEDLQDGSAQTIDLDVQGAVFGSNYTNSGSGCANPPCATLSNTPLITGQDSVSTTFQWQTDCGHIQDQSGCTPGFMKTYDIIISAKDDHCQVPGEIRKTLRITVLDKPPVPAPEVTCISPSGNDITLQWEPPVDTAGTFDSYHIYASSNEGGPYTVVDSIFTLNQGSYTHNGAMSSGERYYYIRTRSGCTGDHFSEVSDTLQLMEMNVNDPNNGRAILQWDPLTPDGDGVASSGSYYYVYREYPMGTWTLIDSVPLGTEEYIDTVTVCSDSLSYRVEVKDGNGCSSWSTIDGGNFKDVLAPSSPVIQRVTVDTSQGKAVIEWGATPEMDTKGYIILRVIGNNEYPIDTVWGRTNTTYFNNASNADSEAESYGVAAFDSCLSGTPPTPNTSAMGLPHTSIYARGELDVCEEEVEITWNKYKNWSSGVKEYRIYKMTGKKSPVYVGRSSPGDTVFVHKGPERNVRTCYVVQALSNDGRSTISNLACFTLDYPDAPNFHYLSSASVFGWNQGVEVRNLVDNTASSPSYRIQRQASSGGFKDLETIQGNGSGTITYKDTTADPQEGRVMYRVQALDSCGKVVRTSNVGETIHLRVNANSGDLVNTLQWTSYRDWDGSIIEYRIYRSRKETFEPVLIASVSGKTQVYEDEVGDLIEDSKEDGQFCYYVQAVESNNSFGISETSRSNIACAFQEPRIYIPNAFMVGGHNDVFKPVAGYVEPERYSMTIFDRWGQEVFHTKDIDKGWEGKMKNGKPAPEGVYVYMFKFTTSYGKVIEKRGSVTLLRSY